MRFFIRLPFFLSLFIFLWVCLFVPVQPVLANTYSDGTYACDAYDEGDCPQVDSLSPNSGIVGDTISIIGQNFGTFAGGVSKIFFQDIPATISDWIDTLIHAVVPGGTTTGTVRVETENGIATSSGNFTINTPTPTTPTNTPAPTPTPVSNSGNNTSSGSSSGGSSSGGSSGGWTCTDPSPGSAPDLYEVDITGSSAVIYFAPSLHPYTNYFVAFGDGLESEGYGAGFSLSQTTGALKYDVYHLKPNSVYTFKVRAGNGCRAGSWSNSITIKTLGKTARGVYRYYPKAQASYSLTASNTLKSVTSTIRRAFQPKPAVTNSVPAAPVQPAQSARTEQTQQPQSSSQQPPQVNNQAPAIKQTAPAVKPSTPTPKKSCFLFLCW